MASRKKQQLRKKFCRDVFQRDNFTCKMCNEQFSTEEADEELNAHHITDGSDMPNGGYVPENGITLCKPCHREAERDPHVVGQRPSDLYGKIGSTFKKAFQKSESLEA